MHWHSSGVFKGSAAPSAPLFSKRKRADYEAFHIDEEWLFRKDAAFTFNVRFCTPFLLFK
jgi:hypothetical protein